MDLSLKLPEHVTAAWADDTALEGWLVAAATAEAERRAVHAAQTEVDAILAAARAPFQTGAVPPPDPTVAQRVEDLEDGVATLAGAFLGGAE